MIRKFYSGLLGASASKKNRKILAVRIAVSVGIIAFLLWWLPLNELIKAIKSVPGIIWLIVIACFLLGHFISALKWRLLLSVVGTHISVLQAVRAHGAGLFANLCLPSIVGGDFVRAAVIVREKGSMESIALGSLTDRINDTFALLMLASIAGFFIPGFSSLDVGNVLTIISVSLIASVLVGFFAIKFIPVDMFPVKIAGIVLKLRGAVDSLISAPHIALLGFILSISIQAAFIGLNIVIATAMNISAVWAIWFFAWPLAKLIALVPVSLGGIGVRESAMAVLMAAFGIDAAVVVAQSLSWQAVLIVSGMISGIFVTWLPGNVAQVEQIQQGDRA